MTTLIRARRAGENLTEKHSGSVSSGKHYMDTIRRLVVEMRREEFASLKQRVVNAQHALAVTVTSFGLATLTGIVLLVAFFNLIQRDLAVQLRHEARLIAARDEAERANQAKSEFISTVSHELRTPLNAITGFSKLLLDPRIGPLNEDQEAYTRDIVGSSDHLLQLINDILDISKIEAGKMTLDIAPFDLSELLHQTPGIVREKAQQKGIELQVKIPEDVTALPLLIADRRKVKQVLYNLLSNAVKFTPVGGRVTLEAQRGLPIGAPAPPDSNVAGNDAPFVTVIVQDTGIGILPENQQRIWNAFEQVDSSESRQFQGTGLGLALTRRMVELHGGLMWLESEFGRGSTFFFSLPLQPPPGILADNSDATERENFAQDTT